MKLILREDVSSLGKSGDLVTVRNGYGRNYLLPQNKAVLANEQNVRQLQHETTVILAKQAKLKAGATDMAKRLDGAQIKVARKVGDQDKLFGSVTTLDISDALTAQGIKIDRR